MVDMDGAKFERGVSLQCFQGMQQNDRVEAARQRQGQARMRRHMTSQNTRHTADNILIWQELP